MLIWILCKDEKDFNSLALKYKEVENNVVYIKNYQVLKSIIKSYIYSPDNIYNTLDIQDIRQLLFALSLTSNKYDYFLVSKSLNEFPCVKISSLENNLIYSSSYSNIYECIESAEAKGQFLRLLPENNQNDLKEIIIKNNLNIVKDSTLPNFIETVWLNDIKHIDDFYKKDKPLIFVWPIYLAVGGVERNTIEITKQLYNKYDFVFINMERLSLHHGSLHHQLKDYAKAIYDLAEITPHKNYLLVLQRLKEIYKPDLIWICNGSPWLNDNAKKIRKLFKDTPIVDQQVYDTKEGWINRYHEEGIQSFDRFIAVNKKIYDEFTNRLRIKKSKIDLIYSALDSEKIINFKKNALEKKSYIDKYGINPHKINFIYLGRLTKQKNPMKFLEIVKSYQLDDKIEFIMVGSGDLSEKVDEYIRVNNLHNIKRFNYIDNTAEIFYITDGIIFTSDYEGLPIAMLEALSMGLPVFSTDVGDVKMILDNYNAGIVCDVNAKFETLLYMFSDWLLKIDYYKSNACENSINVLKRFSSSEISEQYSNLFDALIVNRKLI